MPLRDFERVRERIELHLELRHVAQFVLLSMLLLGGAFGAGYWYALHAPGPPQRCLKEQTGLAFAPLPSPRADMADKRAPILPRPLSHPQKHPRLARVIESVVRDDTLRSATAANHVEEEVRSELHESPLDHVASDPRQEVDRRVAVIQPTGDAKPSPQNQHRAPALPPKASQAPTTLVSGETVDTKVDSPDRVEPQALPPLETIPPELVESRPMIPPEDASTQDTSIIGRCTPPDVRSALTLDKDGAIRVSENDSGECTQDGPLRTLAKIDQRARRVFLNKLDEEKKARRSLERAKAAQADRTRLAKAQAKVALAKRAEMTATKMTTKSKGASPARANSKASMSAAKRAAPKRHPETAQPSPPRRYYVQVKAFRNQSEAQDFSRLLRKNGHNPTLSRTSVPGQGIFFRVRLGPYARPELAKARQKRFEAQEPYETMIMSR